MNLPDIRNTDVSLKKVFVLADLDVPLSGSEISDDTRLKSGWETIKYLLDNKATVIVGGKLGRPEGKFDPSLSLKSVAKWFAKQPIVENSKSEITSSKLGQFEGWRITENLFILENLRFYEGEEKNDSEFAQQLARLADLYVQEAFAMTHRAHASVVGVPQLLPHYAGFHLQQEVEVLSNILDNPKRPLVVIIGGAKIETKLPLISKMEEVADHVLVGGKIAQEFKKANPKVFVAQQNSDGTDITEESVKKFLEIASQASTVVWNGPVGIINEKFSDPGSHVENSEKGTRMLAEGLANINAYKVIGGGDTVEFVERLGLTDKFDFISTGGGAMLSFLSGEKLPGLEVLLS